MSDEILNEILNRIKSIEDRLDHLESQKPQRITPPPVVRKPFPQPKEYSLYEQKERLKRLQKSRQREEPAKPKDAEPVTLKEPEPAKPKEDQEFVFGSKVLPGVGMAILLIAIFFLVALGIKDGWITPTVQFIGELLLCGGLIGIGIWKLEEREDFGYKLVAGGSCGLYFSFAGAHVYKVVGDIPLPLISAEWLVGLFAALSLVNLSFSWWRSSKSFWVIGLLGGLVAAGMPMDRSDHSSSLILAGIIVVASALLAGHRQWFKALAGLWFVGIVFTFAIVQNAMSIADMSVPVAIAIFYGFSLTPILAFAYKFLPSKFDDNGWFFMIAGGITALATLTFTSSVLPVPHSVSIAVWSLSLLAIAHFVRKQPHAQLLLLTGIVSATVIAPMAFTSFNACLTYAVLGVLTTVFVKVRKQGLEKEGAMFSTAFVMLTISAYAVAMSSGSLEMAQEMTMLGAIAVGIVNVTFVSESLDQKMSVAVTAAAAIFYPILTRAAFISVETDQAFAVLISQSIYIIALAIVSIRAKFSGLGVLGLIFGAFATMIYWGSVNGQVSDGREIAVLLVLTTALVLSAIGAGRNNTERSTTSIVAAIIGGFVVVPTIALTLGLPAIGLSQQPAVTIAIAIYSILLGSLSLAIKWHGHAYLSAATIVIGTIFYWSQIVNLNGTEGAGVQIFITLLMSSAIALSAISSARNEIARQFAWVGGSLLGLFVLARVFFLVLTLPEVGMDEQSALLTSWAIYSAVLAATGYKTKLHSIAAVSYAISLLSVAVYWSYWYQGSMVMSGADQLIFTGLQSASLVIATLAVSRSKAELQKIAVLTSIVGWFVFAHMIDVVLTLPPIGMAEQASLTTSWSVYSALVLTLGFIFDFKFLRITSLVMFGITILKVFFVDLAELDDFIRVIVFFVLGALLVLAGYIYVRKRPKSTTSN